MITIIMAHLLEKLPPPSQQFYRIFSAEKSSKKSPEPGHFTADGRSWTALFVYVAMCKCLFTYSQ